MEPNKVSLVITENKCDTRVCLLAPTLGAGLVEFLVQQENEGRPGVFYNSAQINTPNASLAALQASPASEMRWSGMVQSSCLVYMMSFPSVSPLFHSSSTQGFPKENGLLTLLKTSYS